MNRSGSSRAWDESQIASLTEIANLATRYIARRVRGDPGTVEDLRQIVLVQLAKYIANRELDRQAMLRLAYKIARNRIADWYRNGQSSIPIPVDDVLILEAVAEVSDFADGVAVKVDLERALSQLSPQQRRAAVLFYLDGLNRDDVATVMGISIDAVKKHLANGRRRAKQLDELVEYGRGQGRQEPHHEQ